MADPLELAFAAFDQRNFDQAHEYCRRVLEADPRNARALLLSGLVAKKRSKFEEAAVLLEKSIAQSPVPVALGALGGPLAYLWTPSFDLLLTGLGAGTLAWLLGRLTARPRP